jgi:hypothetical protein
MLELMLMLRCRSLGPVQFGPSANRTLKSLEALAIISHHLTPFIVIFGNPPSPPATVGHQYGRQRIRMIYIYIYIFVKVIIFISQIFIEI